jgi:hypothetical protein
MRHGSFPEGRNLKRFTRHLFTLGSAVSLLLCVATAALWVRSYYHVDIVGIGTAARTFGLGVNRGVIIFYTVKPGELGSPFEVASFDAGEMVPLRGTGMGGFLFLSDRKFTGVTAPAWFIMILTGGFGWYRWRVSRRTPPGHCTNCGYDLRASPSRCPECGTVPSGKATT